MKQISEEPLLTEKDICDQLNVPAQVFGGLRRKGIVPYVRFGGRTYRYRLSDVLKALKKLEVSPVR